ncbi:MAG: hypothetical protein RJA35_236 [Actinomycetota bacterium]|jgi:hypothetical protein
MLATAGVLLHANNVVACQFQQLSLTSNTSMYRSFGYE